MTLKGVIWLFYFFRYGTESKFEQYKIDYIALYVDTIKPIVENEDKTRSYIASSPSNMKGSEEEGWIAENPYSLFYGDGK